MKYKLGCSVIIIDPTKSSSMSVLIGKRLSKNGYGLYSFPGGHVEENETVKEAAIREVLEETGMLIYEDGLKELTFTTELKSSDDSKYIRMYYTYYNYGKQEPKTLEPLKCEYWFWNPINEIYRYKMWDNGNKILSEYL